MTKRIALSLILATCFIAIACFSKLSARDEVPFQLEFAWKSATPKPASNWPKLASPWPKVKTKPSPARSPNKRWTISKPAYRFRGTNSNKSSSIKTQTRCRRRSPPSKASFKPSKQITPNRSKPTSYRPAPSPTSSFAASRPKSMSQRPASPRSSHWISSRPKSASNGKSACCRTTSARSGLARSSKITRYHWIWSPHCANKATAPCTLTFLSAPPKHHRAHTQHPPPTSHRHGPSTVTSSAVGPGPGNRL